MLGRRGADDHVDDENAARERQLRLRPYVPVRRPPLGIRQRPRRQRNAGPVRRLTRRPRAPREERSTEANAAPLELQEHGLAVHTREGETRRPRKTVLGMPGEPRVRPPLEHAGDQVVAHPAHALGSVGACPHARLGLIFLTARCQRREIEALVLVIVQ